MAATNTLASAADSLYNFRYIIWYWYIFQGLSASETRHLLRTSYPEICQPPETPTFPSICTLKRAIGYWNFQKNRSSISRNDPYLPAKIWTYFFQWGLSDEEMLRFLERDGYHLTARTLQRLRISLDMKRRYNAGEFATHNLIMHDAICSHLQNGQSQLYGRRMTYHLLRQAGVPVSRDRMSTLLREIDPAAAAQRVFAQQRFHRGGYIVPGPNHVLSIDGHHKLSVYGIEIYAGIDAYSRYITFIHVGISTRTAVAVLRLYLDMVEDTDTLPFAIRSDYGTETVMLANAHCQLHIALQPDARPETFYWYGPSTLNQRIEAWWRQMSKSQTVQWKEFFDAMRDSGLWTGSNADMIALLFVYLPIIREQVYQFADLWNAHTIRPQKNRPHVVSGKPVVLHFTPPPPTRDFGLKPPHTLLAALKEDVKSYNPDEYLPYPTLLWCHNALLALGVMLPMGEVIRYDALAPDGSPLHSAAYLFLRSAISGYQRIGGVLSLCIKPTGAYQWVSTAREGDGPVVSFAQEEEEESDEEPEYFAWEDHIIDGGVDIEED